MPCLFVCLSPLHASHSHFTPTPTLTGAAISQTTTRRGVREDTASAFLRPVLATRPNLHVLTDAFVTRVLFEGADQKAVLTHYPSADPPSSSSLSSVWIFVLSRSALHVVVLCVGCGAARVRCDVHPLFRRHSVSGQVHA